jgi:hypothetical protein
MADAVTYLSRVAEDAGMLKISAEFLAIRKRLSRQAKAADRNSVAKSKQRAVRST